MNFKRIFRVLICLVLVCALLINISPIRAKATGLVEGLVIAGASVVNVPAALVTVATLICLGLMADATAQNPFLLQDIANSCQEHLAATGTLIKDGTVELLRCVTATGEAIYYVGNNFMEAVRSWLFDSETVTAKELVLYPDVSVSADALATAMAAPYAFFSYTETVSGPYTGFMSYVLCYSYDSPIKAVVSDSSGNGYTIGCKDSSASGYYFSAAGGFWGKFTGTAYAQNTSERLVGSTWCGTADPVEFVTSYDLELGALLTVPIDGTSARAWSEEYANRGLYVVPGSGTGGNEGQDGSWFWPLALTLSIAELLAMLQAEQWISQTPPEFDDYTTEEELEVTPAPEFEGYPSIEVSPAPNPNPNPNPGGTPGTGDDTDPDPTEVPNPGVTPNPGTGTDTDTETEETKWFQRIITGIEELPSKFGQWFTDVKTSIQEIPTKFATYFENVTTAIQEIPSKFQSWIGDLKTAIEAVPVKIAETVTEVKTAIQAIPGAIMGGIQTLFVPDPDFLPGKFNALKAKFPIIDPIVETGNNLKSFFFSIGSKAPVIYIDLGAATSWYPMGGKVKFIDLTWYAQYKPTMDTIVGGFIWLWAGWRLFQSAPGILSGTAGVWGAFNSHPDASFNSSVRRKEKDGE